MSKTIESRSCPTCGHDKGSIQKFELAEVPVITGEVSQLLDALKNLSAQLPKSEPNTALTEAISRLGQLEASYQKATAELEAKLAADEQGHVEPSPELVTGWDTCPNCSPKWLPIRANIEAKAREGYVPIEEAQRVATAVTAQLGRGG